MLDFTEIVVSFVVGAVAMSIYKRKDTHNAIRFCQALWIDDIMRHFGKKETEKFVRATKEFRAKEYFDLYGENLYDNEL